MICTSLELPISSLSLSRTMAFRILFPFGKSSMSFSYIPSSLLVVIISFFPFRIIFT